MKTHQICVTKGLKYCLSLQTVNVSISWLHSGALSSQKALQNENQGACKVICARCAVTGNKSMLFFSSLTSYPRVWWSICELFTLKTPYFRCKEDVFMCNFNQPGPSPHS